MSTALSRFILDKIIFENYNILHGKSADIQQVSNDLSRLLGQK